MLTAAYGAFTAVDAATGGATSGWVGGLFGGGASSDQEKAARALSGASIAAGPFTPEQVVAALSVGGAPAFSRLVTAVELKDFMRLRVWGGPWTPPLLANAAVFFAHGGIDGNVVKNEAKIRDAVRALVTRAGVVPIPGPGTTVYLPPGEAPYGEGFVEPPSTAVPQKPIYYPEPAAVLPPRPPLTFPTFPTLTGPNGVPPYLLGLGALVVVVVGVAMFRGS